MSEPRLLPRSRLGSFFFCLRPISFKLVQRVRQFATSQQTRLERIVDPPKTPRVAPADPMHRIT